MNSTRQISSYGSVFLIVGLLLSMHSTMMAAAEKTEAESELSRFESLPDDVIEGEIAPLLSDMDLVHLFSTSRHFKDLLTDALEKRDIKSSIKYWSQPIKSQKLKGHVGHVILSAFSPDGKVLAVGFEDHTICLWNVKNGKLLCKLTAPIYCGTPIAFSPDSKVFAAGLSRTIYLWNVETGNLLHKLKGHANRIESVVFSPDGKILASGAHDILDEKDITSENNMVYLWNVENGNLLRKLWSYDSDIAIAFSPDGKVLAAGSGDDTIRLWNIKRGKLSHILTHAGSIISMTFSPDSKVLASVSHDKAQVQLWNVENGKLLNQLEVSTHAVFNPLGLSPDRKVFACEIGHGTICLFNVENRELLQKLKEPAGALVDEVIFSPDGKALVAISVDLSSKNDSIRLWRGHPKEKTASCSVM